jgi:hypothetical protein
VCALGLAAVAAPLAQLRNRNAGRHERQEPPARRGEVVKLDAAALARLAPGYALDLAPDIGAKFESQPVVVADLSAFNFVGSRSA